MKFIFSLYLFIIPFYPALSAFSIFGYPVVTLFNLFVMALLCVLFFLRETVSLLQLYLFISIITSFCISIVFGWDVIKCLTNMCLYVIPILIFVFVEKTGLDFEEFTNIMLVSLMIAATLSILAMLNILTHTSSYYVNIYYVDGASGIIGIILCTQRALSLEKNTISLKTVLLGICGVIIVLLGQSRARTIISVCTAVFMIFISISISKKENGLKLFFKILLLSAFIAIVGIIVYNRVSLFSQFIDNIIERLNMLGVDDKNVAYRENEASIYLKMFKDNIIAGRGWGIINNSRFLNDNFDQYTAHNMFVSLLGIGGLIFCIPYYLCMLSSFFNLLKGVFKYNDLHMIPGLISFIDVIFLGIASSGFGKLSGVLFMTLIYICLFKKTNKYDHCIVESINN